MTSQHLYSSSVCLKSGVAGGEKERKEGGVGKVWSNEIRPHHPRPDPSGSHMFEGSEREVKEEANKQKFNITKCLV